MIVGHHGGEVPLLLAILLGAGTASPLVVLAHVRLAGARARFRRRTPTS